MSNQNVKTITLAVDDTVAYTQGQLLEIDGSGNAVPADAVTDNIVAIASESKAADNGQTALTCVDLAGGGIAEVLAGGAITAGALIGVSAAGTAIVTSALANRVIGVALEAAASGEYFSVKLGVPAFTAQA